MSMTSIRTALLASAMSLGLVPCSHAAHGVAQYGQPKYAEGFSHFDYVNADAPRGGLLKLANLDETSSFDKLNPFSLRGTAAPGLLQLTFETLALKSADEDNSIYGLLADDIDIAEDQRSVTFHINPRARFSDGSPVTARDAKHSFDTLTSQQASPIYQGFFFEIAQATLIDDERRIRFDFKRPGRDLVQIVAALPVFSRHWAADKAFERITFEVPIASGPYLPVWFDGNKGIRYQRNPDYWGDHLPVRRGTYNFQEISINLYKDYISQLEAIKSGEIDAFMEMRARSWARMYFGKRIDNGELRKGLFEHRNPTGVSGYAFNLRKPKFQDRRVRQALDLAYDFEWINRMVFYSQYTRLQGYFSGSKWSAHGQGPASPEERQLLAGHGDLVLAQALLPVDTEAARPQDRRERLRLARRLLAEAGWHYKDGALRNDRGEPFEIEFFLGDKLPIPFVEAYIKALSQLGFSVQRRTMDAITQQQRRTAFDFDVLEVRLTGNHVPGSELLARFGSASANQPGSQNVAGIQSAVVDDLIQHILNADSEQAMQVATRALDRVLLSEHYLVLQYTGSNHRIAFDHRLAHPHRLPDYYNAYDWLLQTWWKDDPGPGSP